MGRFASVVCAGLLVTFLLLIVGTFFGEDVDPVVTKIETDKYLIEFKKQNGKVVPPLHLEWRLDTAVQNIETITGRKVIARDWKVEQIGQSADHKTVGLIVTLEPAEGTAPAPK